MDNLRGFAILAVIYHHAVLGSEWNRPGLPSPFIVLDDILSPFRIPILIFLSGMVLGKSLAKPGRQFFEGKARRILWPYLVWTTVVLALLGELRTARDAVLILLPITHMWYLWALLVFYCAGFVLRRARPSVWLASAVAAAGVSSVVDFERILYLWPFFVLGYIYANRPKVWQLVSRRWVGVLLAAGGLAAALASAFGWQVQYEAAYLPVVLAGVLVVARPFGLPERCALTRANTYVGTHSLIFYSVHWPAIGLLTMGMGRMGWDQPILVMAAALAVGLVSGLLFSLGADRSRVVDALFVFPKRSAKAVDQSRS